jgi:hypothetical protein
MTIIQSGRVAVSEAADRNRTALALPSDGTVLGVVPGVQSGLVLTKTSGMGWSLGLGRCAIAPATAANGPVIATVTVAETGTFADGDATRDRIDVVTLAIDETATTGNALPPVKAVVIQGAYPASGSPVTPAIPAGSIGLWSVKIAAATSAGGGGWNTANLVDLRPSHRLHAEYTSSVSVPNASGWGVGALTVDATATENNTFSVAGAPDYVNITQDGLYAIGVMHSPSNPAGATPSFCIMRKGASGQVYGTGVAVSGGAWELGTSHSGVSLKNGDTLRFFCQQSSGAAQTWANRIFITKLQ